MRGVLYHNNARQCPRSADYTSRDKTEVPTLGKQTSSITANTGRCWALRFYVHAFGSFLDRECSSHTANNRVFYLLRTSLYVRVCVSTVSVS